MIRMITSFFGAGLLPKAPGTWGSLAALPVGWLLHGLGGPILLGAATIAAFVLGVWATKEFTKGSDDHDPSEIVIDEVVGMWIALMPLSLGMWYMGASAWTFPYPGWITAFIMFRIFDIWKPWIIGWADRMHTPMGVMLDDVLAGIMAALVVVGAAALAHTVFM